jgi:hypothetical protein
MLVKLTLGEYFNICKLSGVSIHKTSYKLLTIVLMVRKTYHVRYLNVSGYPFEVRHQFVILWLKRLSMLPRFLTLIFSMLCWMVLMTTRMKRPPREISPKILSVYQSMPFTMLSWTDALNWCQGYNTFFLCH